MQCFGHLCAIPLYADAHAPCKCNQVLERLPTCESSYANYVHSSQYAPPAPHGHVASLLIYPSVQLESIVRESASPCCVPGVSSSQVSDAGSRLVQYQP